MKQKQEIENALENYITNHLKIKVKKQHMHDTGIDKLIVRLYLKNKIISESIEYIKGEIEPCS